MLIFILFPLLIITSTPTSADPGVQLGNLSLGVDIVVQTGMTQCASFLVFFQITQPLFTWPSVGFYTVRGDPLLTLRLPGEGGTVIDWICNIPAGHALVVAVADPEAGFLRGQVFKVPDGGTECLGDIGSVVFPAAYYSPMFASYTAVEEAYSASKFFRPGTSTEFPSASYPTITANRGLIEAVATSRTTTTNTSSSATQPPQHTLLITSPATPSHPIDAPGSDSGSDSTQGAPPRPTTPPSAPGTHPQDLIQTKKRKLTFALAAGVVGGVLLAGLLGLLSFQLDRVRVRQSSETNRTSTTSSFFTTSVIPRNQDQNENRNRNRESDASVGPSPIVNENPTRDPSAMSTIQPATASLLPHLTAPDDIPESIASTSLPFTISNSRLSSSSLSLLRKPGLASYTHSHPVSHSPNLEEILDMISSAQLSSTDQRALVVSLRQRRVSWSGSSTIEPSLGEEQSPEPPPYAP